MGSRVGRALAGGMVGALGRGGYGGKQWVCGGEYRLVEVDILSGLFVSPSTTACQCVSTPRLPAKTYTQNDCPSRTSTLSPTALPISTYPFTHNHTLTIS